MKDIDEELVSQIKTVFENFDDELSDNGWAKLREKYPEKQNKKLPIWWISGIAAAILIALGLFFALDKSAQKIDNGQQIVKQQPVIKHKTDSIINRPSIAKKQETKPAENPTGNTADKSPLVAQKTVPKASTWGKPIVTDVKKEIVIAKVEQPIKNETLTNQKVVVVQNPINQNAIAANKVDTAQKINNQNQVIANNNGAVVKDPVIVKKTTEQFLNDQSKILAQKPKEERKTKETKSSIEVFSGTFLNYYADNAAKLNAGFGVNANVKLTKSLFVSFGAGVSQNKIEYQKSIPSEVSRSMSSYSFDAANAAPNNNPGASNSTSISDISINAQLLNFDIPVSLKFYPTKKQNFYIATGINSSTYLSQKYTYGYNLSNKNVLGITQTAKQEETEKSRINGFDFATSAIFAIGINQSIGNNSLTFEPYFKPAIGNMGEKNLRINTVGLNLKFNFTSNKK
ncbi:hypothetical protein EZ428_17405 [Pedobacter frigiditerrae]|uniref:Outer membrane protein beta-barrel domain-containing protein n=1 Tax=Pedobacter frigiditerrae TaxID=2530452 RepID=A0A4R0MRD5_9SPHI|nr:hypothetical protein [Pedobacter frigiditerrae]TCC89468.1 hypothetical protein EZ428_17405 [Pedobacter frigiditerrae]